MRVTVVQRVLPQYRVPFFRALQARVEATDGRLSIVAGHPDRDEGVIDASDLVGVHLARNIRLPGPLWWQSRARREVAATRPDVVVLEANPRLLSNFLLLAWCRVARVPAALWGIGQVERRRHPVARALAASSLRAQLRLCAGAIGYGASAQATFRSLGGDRLVAGVAPNSTLDLDEIDPAPRSGPGERPVFLFVGRLVAQKRVDVLLDAAERLSSGGRKCHLLIVGEGPMGDDLRARARNIAGVELLGHMPPADIGKLMGEAHALVLPGRGGLVVHEALAHGIPIVLGPPEVAGDGTVHDVVMSAGAGVVAKDESADGLADAMWRAVDEHEWATRCRAARDAAARYGGLDSMVAGFTDVLARIR